MGGLEEGSGREVGEQRFRNEGRVSRGLETKGGQLLFTVCGGRGIE